MKVNRFSIKAKPGQEIVMTNWIGLEGTATIAKEKEEELLERYNQSFLNKAKRITESISLSRDIDIAKEAGVTSIYPVGEGGIFACLWKMGENRREGLMVDLHKILLKQETVEICEFYNINPYRLMSSGIIIMISDKAYYLVKKFRAEGIEASVIGFMTENIDRLVVNGEECRCLQAPKRDELYKLVNYI